MEVMGICMCERAKRTASWTVGKVVKWILSVSRRSNRSIISSTGPENKINIVEIYQLQHKFDDMK